MSRKSAVELYLEKMPVKAKPIRHLAKLFKKDPSNVRHALNSLL